MNHKRKRMTGMAIAALLGTVVVGAASAMPANAETEIQALKRQLAEQRALIDKLLAAQNSQKMAIEKIETRAAEAPAMAPAPAPAPAASGILPSGLSWYATLDANVANTNSGYGRKFSVGSSGMTASSIGLKADKEISKGWHAIGELEMGLDVSTGGVGAVLNNTTTDVNTTTSTGAYNNANNLQLFSRQAYAGLGTDEFGKLTLGRQYTGSYIAAASEATAFGPGFYGTSALLLPFIGGMPTRVNNSIVYKTPNFPGFLKGLSVWATYTAGSENNISGTQAVGTPTPSMLTDTSGEGYDLAIFYRGPAESPVKGLTAAVTAWTVTNGTHIDAYAGQGQHQGWQALVNYDFDYVKLYATYVDGWYNGSGPGGYGTKATAGIAPSNMALSDADAWSVSAKVPFLRDHAIIASYSQLNDKSSGVTDADASLWGIAYTYKLFGATTLYVNYGKQYNGKNVNSQLRSLKNGGDMVGNTTAYPGFNPDGVMVGINTKF